ncbi:MAG: insulinase family protein [Nanoarchaeota archaeon]|nr:insulinase family protein [Nanoarchaeota archaeon]
MKFEFKRKVLKSGMTLLFEKRKLPVVSVAFAVRNGGINEKPSEKGISHFIEHMLYKGTPTRNSQKIAEEIEKNGGGLNGVTDEFLTAYFCKMPSKHINLALDVLSDMVKNPLFNEVELEKERKVIFEEIKMNHDLPMRYVLEEIQKALYNGALGINLAGNYKTLRKMNREILVERFNQTYTPSQMILVVVGDTDFNKILDFAESSFKNKKGKISPQKFELKNEVKIEKRKGLDQANLAFAYHVPLATNKLSYAAHVLSVLMGGGMSSRLFSEIREKRNLAYVIHSGSEINKFFAYNFVYAGTTSENVEIIKKLILEEFQKVSKSLTEKELRAVKEQIIGNYHLAMEDSQNQMMNLLSCEINGDSRNFYKFEKNISEVKLEDVKKLAKIKKYSFFALVPED